MTLKSVLFEVPFGGSKGEIEDKEVTLREYKRKSSLYIDERTDILGPDVNMTDYDMNIIKSSSITLREAAFSLDLERIYTAAKLRGVI